MSIFITTWWVILTIVSLFERPASSGTPAILLRGLLEGALIAATTARWLVTVLVGVAARHVLLIVHLLLLQLLSRVMARLSIWLLLM